MIRTSILEGAAKVWQTQAGYTAVIRYMPAGHRCGYVILPELHTCYYSNYSDLPVHVHGGLTFGEDGVFGFDCAHWDDKPDFSIMSKERKKWYQDNEWAMPQGDEATVKDDAFCIAECESMAKQFSNLVELHTGD